LLSWFPIDLQPLISQTDLDILNPIFRASQAKPEALYSHSTAKWIFKVQEPQDILSLLNSIRGKYIVRWLMDRE
jgi:hypothetical protein